MSLSVAWASNNDYSYQKCSAFLYIESWKNFETRYGTERKNDRGGSMTGKEAIVKKNIKQVLTRNIQV